jgi:hypothetical protein
VPTVDFTKDELRTGYWKGMSKIRTLTSRLARNPAPLIYIALALLVLGPALLPGYILTLDMVFVPHLPWPSSLSSLAPYEAILHVLNLVIPSQLIEKAILIATLSGAGLGMHRLVPVKDPWPRFAAGVLYMINPFTYGRLMAGQYLVLAGYALMPWFVSALVRFVRRPDWRASCRLGALGLAIALTSLHYLGFAALAAAAALALGLWRARRRPPELRRLAAWGAGGAAVAAIGAVTLAPAQIAGFDERYFLSFRTVADPTFGQVFNTLGLYGFWAEREGQFLLPKSILGWWWLLAIAILVLAAIGAWKNWRRDRLLTALMLMLLASGVVFAQGVMGSPFAPLDHFLLQNLPLARGYREAGKFVGLIALALSYLFGLGAAWLLDRSAHTKLNPQWLPGLLVAAGLAYAPTMLWGAAGQLRAVNYPADWSSLSSSLTSEHSSGRVLFLPWHLYMKFNFAGRIIANPASHFFTRPTLAGDNAEIGLVEDRSTNPKTSWVQSEILAPSRAGVAAKLRDRGFEYVVLAKAADYKDYSWLDSTPGLKLVSNSQSLRVYKLEL